MKRFAAEMAENRAYLSRLDGAIGDGDHGTNMDRGMKKALERLQATDSEDIGASLKAVGMALVSSVGGAAGPLYGTLFLQMGQSAAGRSELDLAGFTDALDAGVQGVIKRGKAEPGDKTMVDALGPALQALREAGSDDDVAGALKRAAEAAREGMEATVPMVARKGRASYLGERSVGHQDPGATSSHLLLKSAADAIGGAG
jgi:dihydroxyacetone kinase-like protein